MPKNKNNNKGGRRKSVFLDKKTPAKVGAPPFLRGVERPGVTSVLRSIFFYKKMLQNGIPLKTAVTLIPLLKALPKQHRRFVVLMLIETIGVHPMIRKKILQAVSKLKL